MSKATEMAKVSARGGFHLLWGIVVSTVISAVGTIVIANLLGADNYGLYSIAVLAPNFISVFRDWGVSTAMIKYSAEYNTQQEISKIRSIFVSGFAFEIIVGLALTIFALGISQFLANIYGRPAIAGLIQITSLAVLTGGLVNIATAAFTGLERMHFNSIMLVVQSIIKTTLLTGLVALGLGTFGAALGFSFGVLVAGVLGLLLVFFMYRALPKSASGSLELINTTKTMLKYGFPLSIGAILSAILTQFYGNLMAFFVKDNASIGNYSVALNFVVLITFFATPVTTMLFPAFSKLDFKKERDVLQNVFQYSVKYASLIVMPVAVMVMALAQPAIGTIFPKSYAEAPLYLALLAVVYLFTALGSLSTANLINSQGDTKYNLKLTIVNVAFGFPISIFLIGLFGIVGLIVTTIVVSLPGTFLGLRFIKKKYSVSIDYVSSAKITITSALAGALTYFALTQTPFIAPIQLSIGLGLFTFTFLLLAVVTKTIDKADFSNIKQITNALGPLRKPLGWLLSIIEKLSNSLYG